MALSPNTSSDMTAQQLSCFRRCPAFPEREEVLARQRQEQTQAN